MQIIIFLFWLILAVCLFFGIRDWLHMFHWSWYENGVGFTIKLIILVLLFIAPSLVKEYANGYYGFSVGVLILYSLFLLALRFTKRTSDKHEGSSH